MSKKNKYVNVKASGSKITLEFDPMFYLKASRRETPPPTRVERAKKGKGSYSRKEKYKKRYQFSNDGISFIIS